MRVEYCVSAQRGFRRRFSGFASSVALNVSQRLRNVISSTCIHARNLVSRMDPSERRRHGRGVGRTRALFGALHRPGAEGTPVTGPSFGSVGMTTETFAHPLKSRRKAEAFRGNVIKTKRRRERARFLHKEGATGAIGKRASNKIKAH